MLAKFKDTYTCLCIFDIQMSSKTKKITILDFLEFKKQKQKITMLTAYDYPMACALDNAGIDAILVGDSMGMVIYGQKNTLPVTVEDIIRHTQAVTRGAKRAMVIADMPFMSFSLPEDGLKNAGKMIKNGNLTQKYISKLFGISECQVSRIKNESRWCYASLLFGFWVAKVTVL